MSGLESTPLVGTSESESNVTARDEVQAGQALVIQAQVSELHALIRRTYELDWSLPREHTPSARFLIKRFHKANKVERVTGPLVDAFELRVVRTLRDEVMGAECAECLLELMLHANDDNAKVLVLALISARVTEACRATMVEHGMLRIINRWLMSRDRSNELLKKLLQVLRGLNVTVASLKESELGFVVQKVKRDLRAKAKALQQNAGGDAAKIRAAEELRSLSEAAEQVVKAWRGRLGLDGPDNVQTLDRVDHTEHASRQPDTPSEAGPVADARIDGSPGETTDNAVPEERKDGEVCEGLGVTAGRTHGNHATSAAIQQGDESPLELREAFHAAAHVEWSPNLHHEVVGDQSTPVHLDRNSACTDDAGPDMHEAHHAVKPCIVGDEAVVQTDSTLDDPAPHAPSALISTAAPAHYNSAVATTATTTPQPTTPSAAQPVRFTWKVRRGPTQAEGHVVRAVVGTQPPEVRVREPRISWADHHGRALEHMCTDDDSVQSAEDQSGQSGSGVLESSTPHGARYGAVTGGEEAGVSDARETTNAGGNSGSACADDGHDEVEESIASAAYNTREEGAAGSSAAISQAVPDEAGAQRDVVREKEDVGYKGSVKQHADGCSASTSADVGGEVADTSVMEEHGYTSQIVVQSSLEGAAQPSTAGDDSVADAAGQELKEQSGGDTETGEQISCRDIISQDAAEGVTESATFGDVPHTIAVTKHEGSKEYAGTSAPFSVSMPATEHTASTESDSSSSDLRLKRASSNDTQGEDCRPSDSAGGAVCGKRVRDEVLDARRDVYNDDTGGDARGGVNKDGVVKRAKDRHMRRPSIERYIPRNVREQRKHVT